MGNIRSPCSNNCFFEETAGLARVRVPRRWARAHRRRRRTNANFGQKLNLAKAYFRMMLARAKVHWDHNPSSDARTIKFGTMVRLFLLAALALGTTSVATAGEQPVCANPGACGSDGGDGECSLWLQDGWVLAGKSYGTGQRVAWDDVAIPWTQHDRRAFPSWGRFAYFAQVPNEPYRHVFAPTFVTPFECHAVLRNLRHGPVGTDSAGLAPPLTAAHAVGKGDPLFLECADPEDGVNEHIYETPALDTETAVCLDGLTAKKSERAPLGAFATKKYEKGDALVRGPAMHLHRSELYNKTADKHEELLNYCFGHKDTDLLLLPYMPVVHSINHDDKDPNVVVEWDMPDRDVRSVLSRPATQVPAFAGGEDPALYLKYTALRDIQPGEELTMDYGPEWKRAWDGRDREKPFRHEIGFDLFPEEWLAEETRGAEFPAFDAERVPVGELKPATLRSGEVLAPYIHRTGLPEGFAGRVADWANDMGITNLMRSYLFGRQLEVDGEERVRINGGTWWVRRFASDWKSNLFYITPDDDESNEQFMHALGRAGWDQVLTGIGKHFDLNSLSCFYPSFIALTHSTYSMMHSDSDHE
jgi:hypothetical protein